MSASNPLARIFESNRLTRINYKDWLRNLRIVLTFKKLGHVLDQELLVLSNHPTTEQKIAYEKWTDKVVGLSVMCWHQCQKSCRASMSICPLSGL